MSGQDMTSKAMAATGSSQATKEQEQGSVFPMPTEAAVGQLVTSFPEALRAQQVKREIRSNPIVIDLNTHKHGEVFSGAKAQTDARIAEIQKLFSNPQTEFTSARDNQPNVVQELRKQHNPERNENLEAAVQQLQGMVALEIARKEQKAQQALSSQQAPVLEKTESSIFAKVLPFVENLLPTAQKPVELYRDRQAKKNAA